MDIFRVEKNVPDVYVKESRDFQLLLRLLTYIISSGKNNADSLKYINDPNLINSELLSLLQGKVGFFTDQTYLDKQIRDVISAFQSVVRYKGSLKGIQEAIYLFFNAMDVDGTAVVIWNNYTTLSEQYYIDIGINAEVENFDLLRDILKYIIPFGYKLNIFFYSNALQKEQVSIEDKLIYALLFQGDTNLSKLIRSKNYYFGENDPEVYIDPENSEDHNYNNRLLGRVDTLSLIGNSDYGLIYKIEEAIPASSGSYILVDTMGNINRLTSNEVTMILQGTATNE